MKNYYPEHCLKNNKLFTVKDLTEALETGAILEARAMKCDKDLNLSIKLSGNLDGIIPLDEFEYALNDKPTKAVAVLSKVGKYVQFKVKSIDENEDGTYKITLSRKEAQKDCFENYISKLNIGDVIDARATYADKYGVFCDIGCGIIALLPIDCVCTTRISDPKKSLRKMSRIKVIVKAIDGNKITLTHKELLGTWEEEAAKFNVGDTVTGIVRIVENYGIFVELTPNLVGLAEEYDGLKPGDNVSVFIKNIIPEKMKIKLIVVGVIDDDDVEDKYLTYDYKLPSSGNIRDWVYSPAGCSKTIESHF